MVVVLIAHAQVEKFEDPESSPYDRYSPRLHKHAASLLGEWCDAVVFATRKFRTQTEDASFNRKRTIAHAIGKDGGEHILRCTGGPSCIAKNRYGITGELPLSWAAFVFEVIEGPHKGRRLWARLNLDHPNATAVQITRAELSAVCRAVGVLAPNDSVELHDLPLVVHPKCRKRPDTGEIVNEVTGYSKKEAPQPAVNAQPAVATTPPCWSASSSVARRPPPSAKRYWTGSGGAASSTCATSTS